MKLKYGGAIYYSFEYGCCIIAWFTPLITAT